DVKAAYFRLAKRYHPDVRHQAGLTNLGPQLEAVFFRVNDAYRALTARPAPAASAPRSAGPSTEREYETMLRQGRELLKDGRSWDAAAVFEQVVEGASGRMRTRARVLLGRAHLLHPERERVAEKELLEAVKEDPAHVEAHYLLGTLYRRRGPSTPAAPMFRRALEIDPTHRASLAEMGPPHAPPAPAAPTRPPVPRA